MGFALAGLKSQDEFPASVGDGCQGSQGLESSPWSQLEFHEDFFFFLQVLYFLFYGIFSHPGQKRCSGYVVQDPSEVG